MGIKLTEDQTEIVVSEWVNEAELKTVIFALGHRAAVECVNEDKKGVSAEYITEIDSRKCNVQVAIHVEFENEESK